METIENVNEQSLEDINSKNLERRERIGKTFGSGYMRTVCILYTIFVAIDLFAGFVSSISCGSDIMLQSLNWMGLMLIRFVPNIICCVFLWMLFSIAHNKHEVSVSVFKTLKWIMVIFSIITLIHFVVGTIAFILTEYVKVFNVMGYYGTVILAIVILFIFSVVKILLYIFMIIGLDSLIKDKDGGSSIKMGKFIGILLIVLGGFYALNMVTLVNISKEIIIAFYFKEHSFIQFWLFIYQNPLNILLVGIVMVFIGIVVLLFNRRSEN